MTRISIILMTSKIIGARTKLKVKRRGLLPHCSSKSGVIITGRVVLGIEIEHVLFGTNWIGTIGSVSRPPVYVCNHQNGIFNFFHLILSRSQKVRLIIKNKANYGVRRPRGLEPNMSLVTRINKFSSLWITGTRHWRLCWSLNWTLKFVFYRVQKNAA